MEQQQLPTPETSFNFTCSAEWHLTRLGAQYAAPIYFFALHLSKGSGRFFPAIHSLAEYFGAHERSIGKAIRKLERAGFFVALSREPGKPVSYQPILHSIWQKKHPGYCLEKVTMPWNDEGVDPLVSRLYAASDGRIKLHPNYVIGMRKLKLTDDAIVAEWKIFYATDEKLAGPDRYRKYGWSGVYGRFMKHLRSVAYPKNN